MATFHGDIKPDDLAPVHLHKTYYDREVLQSRANTLYYNKDMYAWLKDNPGLKIEPKTRFIDMPCHKLARIFCDSVLSMLDKLPKHGKPVSVQSALPHHAFCFAHDSSVIPHAGR